MRQTTEISPQSTATNDHTPLSQRHPEGANDFLRDCDRAGDTNKDPIVTIDLTPQGEVLRSRYEYGTPAYFYISRHIGTVSLADVRSQFPDIYPILEVSEADESNLGVAA